MKRAARLLLVPLCALPARHPLRPIGIIALFQPDTPSDVLRGKAVRESVLKQSEV
jgi:hypothetical protein